MITEEVSENPYSVVGVKNEGSLIINPRIPGRLQYVGGEGENIFTLQYYTNAALVGVEFTVDVIARTITPIMTEPLYYTIGLDSQNYIIFKYKSYEIDIIEYLCAVRVFNLA